MRIRLLTLLQGCTLCGISSHAGGTAGDLSLVRQSTQQCWNWNICKSGISYVCNAIFCSCLEEAEQIMTSLL